MKPRRRFKSLTMIGAILAATTVDAKDFLPLRHGIFVEADTPCAKAPMASLWGYYGDHIAPGHDSCAFDKVTRDGKTYRTQMFCTYIQSGTQKRWRPTFAIVSDSEVIMGGDGPEVRYRWCGASINDIWP